MIRLAYLSVFIGFIMKLIQLIKEFPKIYYKNKGTSSVIINSCLYTIYSIVDIMVSIGCAIYVIEIFLIK